MEGSTLTNNRNIVKNSPIEPINTLISTQVGWNIAQLEGMKSRCSDVSMITKRSNHMPILTTIDKTHDTGIFLLTDLNHISWVISTLQPYIIQPAHQYGPINLLRKVYCSYSPPE